MCSLLLGRVVYLLLGAVLLQLDGYCCSPSQGRAGVVMVSLQAVEFSSRFSQGVKTALCHKKQKFFA